MPYKTTTLHIKPVVRKDASVRMYGSPILLTGTKPANFCIMTNYKAIVTTTNGHKVVRGAIDMVAHFVSEFKKARKSIFVSEDSVYGIALATITAIKFVNEYTGEVYLEI